MPLLDIFRRNSKNNAQPYPERASFLSLPPELRNQIYDLIVQDATLTMIPKKRRRPPPPAMLLASKQVRSEYQSILLSKATIYADVFNYDFRELTAMSGSLYPKDLKYLRMNEHLYIRLQCMRCRHADLAGLRRWLNIRTNSLDRLPWQYCIGWEEGTSNHTKTSMISGHHKLILEMHKALEQEDGPDWELLHIFKALAAEYIRVLDAARRKADARWAGTDRPQTPSSTEHEMASIRERMQEDAVLTA